MDATEYGNKNMSPLSFPSKRQYLQFLEMLDIHPCTLQTLPSGVVVQPPPPYRHQGFGACSLSSDWPLYFGTNFSWGRWQLVCNGQGGWWTNLPGMFLEFRQWWISAVSQYSCKGLDSSYALLQGSSQNVFCQQVCSLMDANFVSRKETNWLEILRLKSALSMGPWHDS